MAKRTADTRAAAAIVTALRRRNRQDCNELRGVLADRGIVARHFPRGIRKIRDAYGDSAVTCNQDGPRRVYVLDPTRNEGIEYADGRARTALTQSGHVLDLLDWLADEYGNIGATRKARRYMGNVVAELEELVEVLSQNGDS